MSCSLSTSSSSPPSTAPSTPKMYTQHDIEQALVGSWSLLEYFSDPYDGKGPSLHPMEPDARGILTYHPDGCMSVHLIPATNKQRQKKQSRTTLNDGFMYTGEYWVELHELDPNSSFVVCHRAEMASLLQLEGKVQRRQVTLPSRNRLVLSLVGFEDLDGLMVRPELMWERISRPCRAALR
ncbi:uncharacterized protein BO95DRAFT_516032 [Aspergillus brunneoviolaceus CBS 621.78]|uniref:Uncharacterized protein n=1 Tax=Aspergillus brunneoviolaceus CBS 621.78 TaxID=1450534 RepID=A0ACD1G457_9EURO|nr:hypothetical protein BO95DRAFT_516032 [Aspergillus brunneoviolaceus CBS 621.78]RAH43972.1 hypothetical protein BO95DRAFT_516032 [Aspergillus brunneoviolaceus CBS 621.78]